MTRELSIRFHRRVVLCLDRLFTFANVAERVVIGFVRDRVAGVFALDYLFFIDVGNFTFLLNPIHWLYSWHFLLFFNLDSLGLGSSSCLTGKFFKVRER